MIFESVVSSELSSEDVFMSCLGLLEHEEDSKLSGELLSLLETCLEIFRLRGVRLRLSSYIERSLALLSWRGALIDKSSGCC